MQYRCLRTAILVLCLLGLSPLKAIGLERSFAVVPHHSSIAAAKQWQPLLSELSYQTGIRFHFVTAPSITEFERRLLRGDYDYAYMNAALFVEARTKPGYRALAQRKQALNGIIVVKKEGPERLSELRNQTIAFPSPRAFGATILTRAELRRRGIPHDVAYLETHESAYRAVARGQFIAAGGVNRSYQLLPQSLRDQLRILLTTQPSPPHVIAANKRIPTRERNRVRDALYGLKHHRVGQDALARLFFEDLGPVNRKGLATLSRFTLPEPRKTKNIVFHVIPRLDEANTRAQMQPLATYLTQRLELEVDLATHADMGAFERAIYAETRPALINANPLQAVHLAKHGYTIIAQQLPLNSPEGMRGVLLVREDSSLTKLSDLKGKKIAFGGNENAFFASIVPKKLLQRSGLEGKYVNASQPGPVSDVVRRLRAGEIDAAGTGTMAVNSKTLQTKYAIHQMRILAQSEPMPGLAWLLSKKIDIDLQKEIRNLLLSYRVGAPGHAALRAGGISGLRPASLADYKVVSKYVDTTKQEE